MYLQALNLHTVFQVVVLYKKKTCSFGKEYICAYTIYKYLLPRSRSGLCARRSIGTRIDRGSGTPFGVRVWGLRFGVWGLGFIGWGMGFEI